MAEDISCPMCGATQVAGTENCTQCGEWLSDKPETLSGDVDLELVTKFRRELNGLVGIWIVFGVICLAVGIFAFTSGESLFGAPGTPEDLQLMVYLLIAIGVAWTISGIVSATKKRGGIVFGLLMSYLSLVGNLINLNICGIMIILIVILQAHRVLKASQQMVDAGIPLDYKP